MGNIGLLERPPEEVSAPSSTSSSRFTGLAVLVAVAAVVLGITALGGPGPTLNGGSQLAANGAATLQDPADPGSGHGAATPDAPAGSSGSQGNQAAPAAPGDAGADASGSQVAPVEHMVSMAGLQFVPAALTVAVGDTVTWVNNDDALHTVTVTDGPETFESELMNPGDVFSYTFTKAGTYSYYCAVHPDMKASVLVAGADVPPADGVPTVPVEEDAGSCVPSAASDAGMRHIEAAHLQTSPGQQVKDLASVDQYVKTHTILLNDMFKPAFDGTVTDAMATSLQALRLHLEAAHLQTSPGQQAADLLALDQYVKTHTVLTENTLAPHMDYTAC